MSNSPSIAVSCKCGKRLRVKEELVGKRVKCPACAETIRVAIREAEGEPPADTEQAPPAVEKCLLGRDFEDAGSPAIILTPHQPLSETEPKPDTKGRYPFSTMPIKPRRDRLLVLTGGVDPVKQFQIDAASIRENPDQDDPPLQPVGTLVFTDVGLLFLRNRPDKSLSAPPSTYLGLAFLPADELGPFQAVNLGFITSFRGWPRLYIQCGHFSDKDLIGDKDMLSVLEGWRLVAAKKRASLGDAGPANPGLGALAEWAWRPKKPMPDWVIAKINDLNHAYQEDLIAPDAPVTTYYEVLQTVAGRLALEEHEGAKKLSKKLSEIGGAGQSAAVQWVVIAGVIVVVGFLALMGLLYLVIELTSRK